MTLEGDAITRVRRVLSALSTLPNRLTPYAASKPQPTLNSSASREQYQLAAHQSEALLTLFDLTVERARLALDVAADALPALARVLEPPPSRFASGGVARDALEASTLALWLSDPEIGVFERLDRALRLRGRDLESERKITNAGALKMPASDELGEAQRHINQQITESADLTRRAGLHAKGMRTLTSLADELLEAGYEYRLYSGLSHGSPIAVNTIRLMYQSEDADIADAAYLYFIQDPAHAYCRAIWAYVKLMQNADSSSLQQTLESVYGELGFTSDIRSYFREPT